MIKVKKVIGANSAGIICELEDGVAALCMGDEVWFYPYWLLLAGHGDIDTNVSEEEEELAILMVEEYDDLERYNEAVEMRKNQYDLDHIIELQNQFFDE